MGWDYVSVEMGHERAHCPSSRWYMSEYGSAVEWYWQEKTMDSEKTCHTATLSTIPYGLIWVRTQASALRSRRLTAWAMALPRPLFRRHLHIYSFTSVDKWKKKTGENINLKKFHSSRTCRRVGLLYRPYVRLNSGSRRLRSCVGLCTHLARFFSEQ
jgi:hypothetical protein